MNSRSTKPYLVRALWEWCSDQGYTPLIQVVVSPETRVPPGYAKDGQIVLNLSASATRNLTMNNDEIRFSARFGGVSYEILVPWAAVAGLFARETGEGMLFDTEEPGASQEAEGDTAEGQRIGTEIESPEPPKKPTLTVVK